MVQFGFILDQSRCIGCHACTVACKSENGVQLGSFRTWVKYTEKGEFPQVKRSFSVLRCNQCTHAPCVTICPTGALTRRADGIVDLDSSSCIGCKSCMQACPYDALYIDEDSGTAEKCHFCAHRTEMGLAPACAVICPTEAIIPGDFDDPNSRVSRIKAGEKLVARKPEAGTEPNVLYREVDPAGIDPLATNGAGGYLWAQQQDGVQHDAELFAAMEERAQARTTYSVDRKPLWGWKITSYLFTKSLAAGLYLAALPFMAPFAGEERLARGGAIAVLVLALVFLASTLGFLVLDLRRPDRFLKILLQPNWRSWLVRGSFILMAYGALLCVQLAMQLLSLPIEGAAGKALAIATALCAALAAIYSTWLLRQGKGRVLWLKRGMELDLLLHAGIAGAAGFLLLCIGFEMGLDHTGRTAVVVGLITCFLIHLAYTLLEDRLAPRGREEEYRRVVRLINHGPFWSRHWGLAVTVGILLPCTLFLGGWGFATVPWSLGALCALVGLYFEEDIYVRAAQALPIS